MTTLLLKRDGSHSWVLLAEKGHAVYSFSGCIFEDEAMAVARAWASSWNSVCIRLQDEQGKTRD